MEFEDLEQLEADPRRRCAVCGEPFRDVVTMLFLPREVVQRYQDGPPLAIPDGGNAKFMVRPCGHEMTLLQLREAGVEPERYEHPR
ncbi:hypothetical protein AB0N38_10725 [Micromonospora aurantiaca]|uniref:hypothetical protein n=1 Tax=Micromonospora aurantiaca (nom. illeg.) TaxID=47850 RepID=UPI0034340AB7